MKQEKPRQDLAQGACRRQDRIRPAQSLAALLLLTAVVSSGAVVIQVAGLPAPATGTIGEDGPATEAALNSAEDVAVAPNGDIYIADRNSSRLLRIRDGVMSVAYRGDFSAGENDFSSVAVAGDGTLYFTNGLSVLALDEAGAVTEVVALAQPGQANGPKLAVDSGGSLLMAGGRIPRVSRIETDGSTTLIAGADEAATAPGEGDGQPASEARFGSISDIAVDSSGAIYIADEGFGDVRQITSNGTVLTAFGGGNTPVGDIVNGTLASDVDYGSAEIGVAVGGMDHLYIVPRLTGRVFQVDDDGGLIAVAGGGTNPGSGFAPLDTQLQAPFRLALTATEDILVLVEDGRLLFQVPGEPAAGALVASVPSPGDINLDPIVVATSVALTAGMLLLVPFPGEIFNNVLVEHHDRIRRWFRRSNKPSSPVWGRPWAAVLGLVAMALLYSFLDPGFGLDLDSIQTFIGLLVGVVITTLGFALPSILMRRSGSAGSLTLRVLPVALAVGVVCVLISRLIGFLPGYLYGMALGLSFAHQIGEDEEASEITVISFVLLAIAIGSWFGLGLVRSNPGNPSQILEAMLAMTTVSAFEGLVFGLLPIYGMPGRLLARTRRKLWILVWGASILAFFHVLINPQSGYLTDTAIVPVATTYALLAFFTAVSIGLWAWFRRIDSKQ